MSSDSGVGPAARLSPPAVPSLLGCAHLAVELGHYPGDLRPDRLGLLGIAGRRRLAVGTECAWILQAFRYPPQRTGGSA